jgi:hypothetical protein
MGEVYPKRSLRGGNSDCGTELREVIIEFGLLCAPGILFEPVARVSIRLRDEAEAFATKPTRNQSMARSRS